MAKLVAFSAPKARIVWINIEKVVRIEHRSGRKFFVHFSNMLLSPVEIEDDLAGLAARLASASA
ncbi:MULTISPECIES: hypothetical protein [unclassified Brevundimonas]|uniref:hypothetical protein n=1 Tax=unclassified Brevundimonas TaxID=2622653 RepID=UPI003F9265CD